MNLGRKGALLMLAVVAFSAAVPVLAPMSACLLGTRHASQHDCCRAMAATSDSPAMSANSSCCQTQGQNPAVPSVPPYSFGHSQKLALVTHEAQVELPVVPGTAYPNALESPPLKFPPGGAFALRI
jgi:hypothetical protein